jgi:hypothetical protein
MRDAVCDNGVPRRRVSHGLFRIRLDRWR